MQRGYNVLHPIGWDSFGLPAENAAIKRGQDPAAWTYANIEQQKASMRRYACSFDWDRVLYTSDPEYYRWNQWLFLRFFERGLAYRKPSMVNWCPKDQTVLANEQVVQGRCERCDTPVTKKKLTQWYFKITEYADRLLDDMEQLEGRWPDKVLTMQRNWIGRSDRADVDFAIEGRDEPVTVFTTRPDTLYGATFFVVAADSDLAAELAAGEPARGGVRRRTWSRSARTTEIERLSSDREKTGVLLDRYAINPVNGERLPIWAADYVLADYGTARSWRCRRTTSATSTSPGAFDLPVRVVVETGEDGPGATGRRDDRRRRTGQQRAARRADARPSDRADRRRSCDERGAGRRGGELSAARLADLAAALLGHADPDHPLPDRRRGRRARRPAAGDACRRPRAGPAAEGQLAAGRGRRLGERRLPAVRRAGRRATPTRWTRSSTRPGTSCATAPRTATTCRSTRRRRQWLPVDEYIGGITHAILHLLYARFFTKVLYDLGMVYFIEPFTRLLNQGMVIMDGSAMSKSRGNLVPAVRRARRPRRRRGAHDDGVRRAAGGRHRLGGRLGRRFGQVPGAGVAAGRRRHQRSGHRRGDRRRRPAPGDAPAVDDATRAVETMRFNVAVARCMELVNAARKAVDGGPGGADPAVREAAEAVARDAVAVRAVHRRGDVGAAGPPADGGAGGLAVGRPGPAGGGERVPASCRSPARCGTGWRCRWASTRRHCASWPWRTPPSCGRWTGAACGRSSSGPPSS